MGTADLSGATWWRANQSKFPNSREITDLDPKFGIDVERFIRSLRLAGALVSIKSTRRNAARAHLMHYSWKVAYREVGPDDVPDFSGVNLQWDHGDLQASRQGAREMVNLFGLVHVAALKSNHILGKAIDMDITWKDTLVLTSPTPLRASIETTPRNGQNRGLHAIAEAVFNVRKLISDPPHWSSNGR